LFYLYECDVGILYVQSSDEEGGAKEEKKNKMKGKIPVHHAQKEGEKYQEKKKGLMEEI